MVNTWPSIPILNGFLWRALVLSYLEGNSVLSTMHVRKGNQIRNRTRKLHLCATQFYWPHFSWYRIPISRVDGPWPQKCLEYSSAEFILCSVSWVTFLFQIWGIIIKTQILVFFLKECHWVFFKNQATCASKLKWTCQA